MGEGGNARDRGYRDLVAWQRAMDLVGMVYEASRDWPKEEQFGLTNQARRAAVSVPANIAEGKGRSGVREYLHHVSIAHGSLCEIETHLLLAGRLGYLDAATLEPLLERSAEVGRLLRGPIKRLHQAMPTRADS